jgi:ribosome recycling factor
MSIENEIKQKMQRAVQQLSDELQKLRTGRAHPELLNQVMVESYGSVTPITQVSSISVDGSRSLMVNVWDKANVSAVEKGIIAADLGLNPMINGTVIRVPMPPLTEERRLEVIKVAKNICEHTKVTLRNLRREAIQGYKSQLKEKTLSEDESRRLEQTMQKLTDQSTSEVDEIFIKKEQEILKV